MRAVLAILAAVVLPVLCAGADVARCRLSKGLYEDRLALERRGPSESAAAEGALRLAGGGASTADPGKLQVIDQEYRRFFAELADITVHNDTAALEACCEQASPDRAGVLMCQLATFLAGGRKESKTFLELFPTGRKETALLWDLDSIGGAQGRTLFPPKGPSYKLIDELFLLVLDERDQAIPKYFNLASQATGEAARYMDEQIKLFLRESPAVVVNQWLQLRRYRPKLKTMALAMQKSASAAEIQKVMRAVRTFCEKDNPDCPDILKLYAGK